MGEFKKLQHAAQIIALLLCVGISLFAVLKMKEEIASVQQKISGSEELKEKQAYSEFMSLAEPAMKIPGLAEGLIPQGIAVDHQTGTTYLSGYFKTEQPSVIAAIDTQGKPIATYELWEGEKVPFTGHVGGLAVSGTTLYVSAKNEAEEYQIAAIPISEMRTTGSRKIILENLFSVPVPPSFLSFADDTLWVGNFYYPKAGYDCPAEWKKTAGDDPGGMAFGYNEVAEGKANAQHEEIFPDRLLLIPERVQGMAVIDEETILFSQSFGRKTMSKLLFYEWSEKQECSDTLVYKGRPIPVWDLRQSKCRRSITAMPMSEGICMNQDHDLLVLFESGAEYYADGWDRTDVIWRMTH